MSLSIDQKYQLALQNFQSGDFLQAEKLCKQLLQDNLENADANHLMGVVVAKQGGNHEIAAQYIMKALALNSNNAAAHNNLGYVFKASGENS